MFEPIIKKFAPLARIQAFPLLQIKSSQFTLWFVWIVFCSKISKLSNNANALALSVFYCGEKLLMQIIDNLIETQPQPKKGEEVIQPLVGITTATQVFDEINIAIVKPKPRIID